MNFQDLGSIGELVAAIATVITLAYLAIQIRENTKTIQSESRGRISNNVQAFSAVLGGSQQASSVFTRGLADFASLNAEEKTQFVFLFAMVFNVAYDLYKDYQIGFLDLEKFEQEAQAALGMLGTSGGLAYWQMNSHTFEKEFREYVETKIKEGS